MTFLNPTVCSFFKPTYLSPSWIWLLAALLAFIGGPCLAGDTLSAKTSNPDTLTAYANSYRFSVDQQAHLTGNVTLHYQEFTIESDEAHLDNNAQTAQFNGNIQLMSPAMGVSGDTAEVNLKNNDYNLFPADFWFTDSPGNGHADQLHLLQGEKIELKNGTYTTCDPSNPEWSVAGHRIQLDPESGWGEATHMRLNVQEVPVAYFPYFRFPIDDRRQSGLLYPAINNLAEPDIGLPIYWNIAPNFDWTFTPRQIGGRGTMIENEWRYLTEPAPNHRQRGQVFIGHLSTDNGFDNLNRTQFQWQHEGTWTQAKHSVQAQVRYNYLSDNNYLDDFGNSLLDTTQTFVPREAALTWQNSQQQASLRLERLQTLDESIATTNLPYRRLPELNWQHFGLNLGPIVWSNQLNYVYFEQPDATLTPYGHRVHWLSDVSLPKYALWGFFNPTIRLQQTEYRLPNPPDDQENQSRTIGTFILDSGLFFEREFSTPNKDWLQTLEPRLYHTYTPYRAQQNLPNFDASSLTFGWEQLFRPNRFSGFDRIGDTHQTTLAVTQRWLSSNTTNTTNTQSSDSSPQTRYELTAGQIIYHKDRELSLDANTPNDTTLSPLVLTGTAFPKQNWRAEKALTWNSETNHLDEGYFGVGFQKANTNAIPTPAPRAQPLISPPMLLNLGYRYNALSAVKQSDFSFVTPLNQRWALLGRWLFDLDARQTLEQISGFRYESCCWRTNWTYHRRIRTQNDLASNSENQYRIMIEFELKGLARVGSQLQNLLQNSIPGYGFE